MGRRSKQSDSSEALAAADALRHYAELPLDTPLRTRAAALAPIIYALRDIGSGLLPGVRSARTRLLEVFRRYPGVVIPGSELFVVAGIDDWARRLRELRVEYGWPIYSGATFAQIRAEDPEQLADIERQIGLDTLGVGVEDYVLLEDKQDLFAARHWRLLKQLRNSKLSVQDRILELLKQNVGQPISGEQLRYVAGGASEWARRVRELRTEEGWPVLTKMQGRPEIAVGSYMLADAKQAPPHDRRISDSTRIAVLTRDGFSCRHCGWSRKDLDPDDPRRFLELHHVHEHAEGGQNSAENLVALCNVDHDAVHAGQLLLPRDWP
ncbi:MAG: HNH endonuclease [Brevundimonas sp.]|nr:HNH endonuclease [Brevundimonas sp.]